MWTIFTVFLYCLKSAKLKTNITWMTLIACSFCVDLKTNVGLKTLKTLCIHPSQKFCGLKIKKKLWLFYMHFSSSHNKILIVCCCFCFCHYHHHSSSLTLPFFFCGTWWGGAYEEDVKTKPFFFIGTSSTIFFLSQSLNILAERAKQSDSKASTGQIYGERWR